MSKTEERVLVQGTVTFTINCNKLMGLVTPEIANDERRLKDWLEDSAFKMIESAESNVDIDFIRKVNIDEDTTYLTDMILSQADWKKVIKEDKANKGE